MDSFNFEGTESKEVLKEWKPSSDEWVWFLILIGPVLDWQVKITKSVISDRLIQAAGLKEEWGGGGRARAIL